MAKHGNRTAGRPSGSADVLEALGVKLEVSPEQVANAIEQIGIGFLFARSYHPAMRNTVPVRAELGIRTVFNILGPLTNPAGATHQLLGVADKNMVLLMANVLQQLGITGAMVVYGQAPDSTRYDDVCVAGTTQIAEVRGSSIREYTILPKDLGLALHPSSALVGGDASTNATIVKAVLGGHGTTAQRDAVAANAGAALYIADASSSLEQGVHDALRILESGAALQKLEALAAFLQQ